MRDKDNLKAIRRLADMPHLALGVITFILFPIYLLWGM